MVAIIPMLLGVAALFWAGRIAYEMHQFLAELRPATAIVGEVVGKSPSWGSVSMRTVPIDLLAVHYTDASGRELTGRIGANEGFKKGDRVEILYSPSNPDPNHVLLPKYADLSNAYLPAAIGLLFVLGAIAWYVGYRV